MGKGGSFGHLWGVFPVTINTATPHQYKRSAKDKGIKAAIYKKAAVHAKTFAPKSHGVCCCFF